MVGRRKKQAILKFLIALAAGEVIFVLTRTYELCPRTKRHVAWGGTKEGVPRGERAYFCKRSEFVLKEADRDPSQASSQTVGGSLVQHGSGQSFRPGITLALHGDISRLQVMIRSRHQWKASVAIAVLVRNSSELVAVEKALAVEETDGLAKGMGLLRWCAYLPPRQSACKGWCRREDPNVSNASQTEINVGSPLWHYPANIMRNRALQLVETQQVMLLDADFIPSLSMQQAAQTGVGWLRHGELLIIPPFQLRGVVSWRDIERSQLLTTKSALIHCLDNVTIDNCRGTGLAVAPFSRYLAAVVNYKTFWSSGTTRPYSAPFVIDAEPYFISNTAEHLTFDERYVAWGGDKAEQFHRVMLQLHANLGGLTSWVGNEESDKTHTDTAAPKSRTDANAEHWRSGNVRLYDELQGLIWPSRGLWHSTYVDWQAIYPARVLEHPEDFEYGLFPYNP